MHRGSAMVLPERISIPWPPAATRLVPTLPSSKTFPPGHNQFAAHIGIDVNLAACSEDIALDRRIDVERSPYHHNRIHGCIDANRAARGEDVVIYREGVSIRMEFSFPE